MDRDEQTRRQFCTRTCSAAALAALGGAIASTFQGCGGGGSSSPTAPGGVGGSSALLPTVDGAVAGGAIVLTIDAGSPLASAGGLALVRSSAGNVLVWFVREWCQPASGNGRSPMTTRLPALSLTLLLAGGGVSAAAAPAGASFAGPAGGFVVDGGDLEAAALNEGSCLDPALAEDPGSPTAGPSLAASARAVPVPDPQAAPAPRPVAFEYSDGYRTRLKVHKYASFAMVPLFVAQFAVGQKLYDGNASDGTRTAHKVLAGSTAALFAVNTVTGVWNAVEGRKDPNRRTKRVVHGVLMALAEGGFVATALMNPGGDGGTSQSTHRAVALTSMGVATAAWVLMLIH
jgi:hypothetical protein